MKTIVLCLLFCLSVLGVYAQTKESSVRYRTSSSEIVIEGIVIECESFWNENHTEIFTSNLLQVSKIFKGNIINDKVEIITRGGKVDNRFSIVSHEPTLKVGMEGVFFCRKQLTANSLQKTPNYPCSLINQATGFIQYFYQPFNPPAADKVSPYKNITKEIWDQIILSARQPVRRLNPNTNERILGTIISPQYTGESKLSSDYSIYFTFENVTITDNFQKIEFDIYASVSENGIRFGKGNLFVNYSADVFGDSAVSNGGIIVSKGTVIHSDAYSLTSSDEAAEKMKIEINSSFTSFTELYSLTTVKEQICHVELNIENLLALASISFDDFKMSGNSWWYDLSSSSYIPFSRVAVENPITSAGTEDPPIIYYEFNNTCVTESGGDKFLEFDIDAYSNVGWTRLSWGSIFTGFNPNAFDSPPEYTYSLNPTLDSFGYTVDTLFYGMPANILETTIIKLNATDTTKLFLLPTTPTTLIHLKVKIKDCAEQAGITFADSLMVGNEYYFSPGPVPLLEYSLSEDGLTDVFNQYLCIENAPIITDIFPLVLRAGTFDTLTIKGKGFKPFDDDGTVFFRDAGFPDSMIFNPAYYVDITTYTDTLIRVLVPSDLNMSNDGAGTGKIKVMNSVNRVATSDKQIEILYSIMNVRKPDTAYRVSLVNWNGIGGYTWEIDYELETVGAAPCIEQAIDTWKCATKVNWSFKNLAEVETQFPSDDGRNVIFIGDTIPPDSTGKNYIARTTLAGYENACDNGNTIVYYVDNSDIEINPYYFFAFNCDDIDMGTNTDTIDFFHVMLHELGHSHMLQHTVSHPDIVFGYYQSTADQLSANDIAAGKDVIDFSLKWISSGNCDTIPIHDTVSCMTNGIVQLQNKLGNIVAYPNPFTNVINLDLNDIQLDNIVASIYDATGILIISEELNLLNNKEVSLSVPPTFPVGFYILRLTSNNYIYSTMLVKL